MADSIGTYTDPYSGARLNYPAKWTYRRGDHGIDAFVRSPDGDVVVQIADAEFDTTTADPLRADFERMLSQSKNVDYQRLNVEQGWYVISSREGDRATYMKVLYAPGLGKIMTVGYSYAREAEYEQAITLLSRSFALASAARIATLTGVDPSAPPTNSGAVMAASEAASQPSVEAVPPTDAQPSAQDSATTTPASRVNAAEGNADLIIEVLASTVLSLGWSAIVLAVGYVARRRRFRRALMATLAAPLWLAALLPPVIYWSNQWNGARTLAILLPLGASAVALVVYIRRATALPLLERTRAPEAAEGAHLGPLALTQRTAQVLPENADLNLPSSNPEDAHTTLLSRAYQLPRSRIFGGALAAIAVFALARAWESNSSDGFSKATGSGDANVVSDGATASGSMLTDGMFAAEREWHNDHGSRIAVDTLRVFGRRFYIASVDRNDFNSGEWTKIASRCDGLLNTHGEGNRAPLGAGCDHWLYSSKPFGDPYKGRERFPVILIFDESAREWTFATDSREKRRVLHYVGPARR